ncbi:hypothetical protein AX16_007980 [Volvariella volvacea WC 439]|nr:hypothetical protein AX16_007980 [Volvariella volvacea WC 439]
MPVLEICSYVASEAFIMDPLVHRKALEMVTTAEGYHGLYTGLQSEDRKTGYLLVGEVSIKCVLVLCFMPLTVWETYEHHKKFIERPDYGNAMAEFMKAVEPGTQLDVEHFTYDGPYLLPALISPVTEIVFITPPADKLDEAVGYHINLLAELAKAKCCHSPQRGMSIENPNKMVGVVGWDSIELHYAIVSPPTPQEYVKALTQISEAGLVHVTLSKFSP